MSSIFKSDLGWNGVTTSKDGRTFVVMTRTHNRGPRIAEIVSASGELKPYPDDVWNSWEPGENPKSKFVHGNALRIASDGKLWIVDTGSSTLGEPRLADGVKLVSIDLSTNKISRVYSLGNLTNENSMVDDVRFNGSFAYLTDAGSPGLIILDLDKGTGRRVLEDDASTTANRPLLADGKELRKANGELERLHADQLEISPDGERLYFQSASGPMYRIKLKYLNDALLTASELSSKVEFWFDTPSTGGTAIDADENLYVSDVNTRSIWKISSKKEKTLVISDDRLDWADALWIDDAGSLLIPAAQLQKAAAFQKDKISKEKPPYELLKIKIAAKPLRN